MARELKVSQETWDDILEIRMWYEKQQRGLEHEFVDELERAFGSVTDFPEMADWISDDSRRKALRRFPYVVYFTFNDVRVLVVAVMHSRRATSVWKKRFQGL